MPRSPRVRTRRIYDPPDADDGVRILVDRLWPRGISRTRAALDLWLPEAAPSPPLRRWFGHEAERWAEFRRRYLAELARRPRDLAALVLAAGAVRVTLLHAARDSRRNHAAVLAELVAARARATGRRRSDRGTEEPAQATPVRAGGGGVASGRARQNVDAARATWTRRSRRARTSPSSA